VALLDEVYDVGGDESWYLAVGRVRMDRRRDIRGRDSPRSTERKADLSVLDDGCLPPPGNAHVDGRSHTRGLRLDDGGDAASERSRRIR
jgi:hypothetical protein